MQCDMLLMLCAHQVAKVLQLWDGSDAMTVTVLEALFDALPLEGTGNEDIAGMLNITSNEHILKFQELSDALTKHWKSMNPALENNIVSTLNFLDTPQTPVVASQPLIFIADALESQGLRIDSADSASSFSPALLLEFSKRSMSAVADRILSTLSRVLFRFETGKVYCTEHSIMEAKHPVIDTLVCLMWYTRVINSESDFEWRTMTAPADLNVKLAERLIDGFERDSSGFQKLLSLSMSQEQMQGHRRNLNYLAYLVDAVPRMTSWLQGATRKEGQKEDAQVLAQLNKVCKFLACPKTQLQYPQHCLKETYTNLCDNEADLFDTLDFFTSLTTDFNNHGVMGKANFLKSKVYASTATSNVQRLEVSDIPGVIRVLSDSISDVKSSMNQLLNENITWYDVPRSLQSLKSDQLKGEVNLLSQLCGFDSSTANAIEQRIRLCVRKT